MADVAASAADVAVVVATTSAGVVSPNVSRLLIEEDSDVVETV